MFKKVLYYAITAFFSLQYIVGAVPIYIENVPIISKEIFIPESYGIIEKSSFDKYLSSRFVILLKDAHCNYDAQQNIARMLEVIVRDYKIDLVAIEGAVGDLDYERFGKLENEPARGKMADSFVKKGFLTGPEYLAITKYGKLFFNIYGIEDEKLYMENFITFRQTINHLEESLAFVNELNRVVAGLKGKLYSKDLLEFDNKSMQYYENTISLIDWVKELNAEAGKLGLVLKEYPNISLTLDSITLEEKIDFKKVESERAEAIGNLEKILSKEDLKNMVEKSLQFRLGKIASTEYYKYLEQLLSSGETNPLEKYPNLSRYIQLVKMQSWINNDVLFTEIARLEDSIKEVLFQNNIQRQLDSVSRKARILNGLFKLTLNREDIGYYRDHKAEFMPSEMCSFINIQAPLNNIPVSMLLNDKDFIDKVSSVILDGEKFYNIALERDVSLVENTLRVMEEKKKTSAVMVIGGFHADGVIDLFEAKGVGYVVITPKIVKAEKEGLYLSLMMDKRIKIAQAGSTLSQLHPLADGARNEGLVADMGAMELREDLWDLAFQTYYMYLGKEVAKVAEEEALPFEFNANGTVGINSKYTGEIPEVLLESFRAGLQEFLSRKENLSLREFFSKSEMARKYLARSAVVEYRLRIGNAAQQGILGRATLNFIQFYLNLCRLHAEKGMPAVTEELGERQDFLPRSIKDLEEGAGYRWPQFKEDLVTQLKAAKKEIGDEVARGIVNYLFTMNAYGVNEGGDFYETLFFSSYMQLIEDVFGAEKLPELQKLLDRLRTYRFLQVYIAKEVYKVEKANPVKDEDLASFVKKRGKIDNSLVAEMLAQYLAGEQFAGQGKMLGELKKRIAQNFVEEERSQEWWVKVARGLMKVNEESVTDPLKRAVYVTTVSGIGVKDALGASEGYTRAVERFKTGLANALGERVPSLEKAAKNPWTCIRDVSLYIRDVKEIEKGKRYAYKNVGAAGIQALKDEMLSPNISHRFLYTTEEEKEAAKLYFAQNGITVTDDQFFQIDNYTQARTSEAVNVVMLSAENTDRVKKQVSESNDRLLVGHSGGSDLMLMDTLAYAVAEKVGMDDSIVKELGGIFVDILREYYRGMEGVGDLDILLRDIISYENGILTIKLPEMTAFVRLFYDNLMQAREVISKAA